MDTKKTRTIQIGYRDWRDGLGGMLVLAVFAGTAAVGLGGGVLAAVGVAAGLLAPWIAIGAYETLRGSR
jgi:hypothetical protein